MKSRRRNVPEDPQTIRRRSSRLSADELLSKMPTDLVIEIFSRLPLKSIAISESPNGLESITRVEFQGMRPFRKGWGSGVFTLLNHVEDVKLI
ncbi:BnaCnng56100D [Brassica napus]|uniref:F-box domain-containing protein n=2 Tax=Brassica TaxID=3705 RepID=M4DP00_BRACM|nr:unnamed protein product [Brassica napus]CDY67727.1 BnaCnng56100D [Brassica napus]